MVLLGGLSYLPGLENIADIADLFKGFSSNAVISIIAVMIIGAGLDRTGLMSQLAGLILRYGGNSEKRIIPIVSATVGVISSFMQNVGAAALFLPVVSRISVRSNLPLSRLLMPMGFCAILGGTMTMVGSSPLILLNDLDQIDQHGDSAGNGDGAIPFVFRYAGWPRTDFDGRGLLYVFRALGSARHHGSRGVYDRSIHEGLREIALWP